MALISCPECGAQISDRAPQCPKCGCPIASRRKCPECGTSYDNTLKECPNCGCPAEITVQETTVTTVPHDIIRPVPLMQPVPFMQPAPQPTPNIVVNTTTVDVPQNNAAGIVGFIFALLGLLLSWAPGANFVVWIIGFLASLIGLFKKPRGLAITGLLLSLIDVILIVVFASAIASLVNRIF